LIYIAAGTWSQNTKSRLTINNQSGVTTAVNAVHAWNAAHPTNTPIKILGFLGYAGFASNTPEDMSPSTHANRWADCVNLCNVTGLDGIQDDIEQFSNVGTNGINEINFYNGLTSALHAMNPPRLSTHAHTIGNNGPPWFDEYVYPGLHMDLVQPMFYNGQDSAPLINQFWNTFFAPGYSGSPLSIGLRCDRSSMSSIITAINAKTSNGNNKPSNLAGYSIWSYDAGNMVPSSTDWTAWTNWTGKNFPGCGGSTPPPSQTLTKIEISPALVSLALNATTKLVPVCKDQNNVQMNCPTLVWSSSNTQVATVDNIGQVKGISEGIANITLSHTSSGIKSNLSQITVGPTPPPGTAKTYNIISGTLMRSDGRQIVLTGGTIVLKEV
jgi:hypothetical protein